MTRRVMIVGASAAGLRCAARLRRLCPKWKITVLERNPEFSFSACGLPYFLSGDVDALDELRSTSWGALRDQSFFEAVKNVEILRGTTVCEIDPVEKTLEAEGPDGKMHLGWDELVLATGASAIRIPGQPDHPRVGSFHAPDDAARLKRSLARGEIDHVALVGAGLVGIELAEAFREMWGIEVSLVEAGATPLPEVLDIEAGIVLKRTLESEGVRVYCGAPVEAIEAGDDGVVLQFGSDSIQADCAVVAVGVRPEVDLGKRAGVALGKTGAIAVDEHLATSVPHIWAVGDCIEVRHAVTGELVHRPMGSLANRQGRVLAGILAGRGGRFGSVAGSTAVKAFDLSVAAAGCSLREAREKGFHAEAAWMTTDDRAHFWPESQDLHIQLVFEVETMRFLGIQALGSEKSIDVVDVATQSLLRGQSIAQLEELEHCYAPPFAPALAPLAVAAFIARNLLEGQESVSPIQGVDGHRVLDVRLPAEQEARPWAWGESLQIPLENLRSRFEELDPAISWLVVCERGTRSAEALRCLRERNMRGAYLGGGLLWRTAALGENA